MSPRFPICLPSTKLRSGQSSSAVDQSYSFLIINGSVCFLQKPLSRFRDRAPAPLTAGHGWKPAGPYLLLLWLVPQSRSGAGGAKQPPVQAEKSPSVAS